MKAAALLFAAAAAGMLAMPVYSADNKPSEYEVKAAFLTRFVKYVEWPVKSNGPFQICVLGKDPFGAELDKATADEKVDGQPIIARRIASLGEISGCHILFISASESRQLKVILPMLEKSALLTVSDVPDFSRRGGMIQFVPAGSHIGFEVNRGASKSAGLSVSSQLLKLAIAVRGPS
jgi:hypothetical protein